MAELNENTRIPTNLEINKCTIVSADGKSMDFKNSVVEFNYYEDIFSNCTSGVLVLSDSSGRQNQLSWTGDEYLILEFSKPETSGMLENYNFFDGDGKRKKEEKITAQPFKGIFRIYTVKGRHLGNDTNENLTLNFCSEELFLSERMKISQAYSKMKISAMVKDIAKKFLQIPDSKFGDAGIEETYQDFNVVIPKLKPLEAINWLSTMAISKDLGPELGANYLFFRNRDGYQFRSILSIFKDIDRFQYTNPLAAIRSGGKKSSGYWYGMKNVEIDKKTKGEPFDPYEQIISYQIMNSFDSVESHQRGIFGNRMMAINYLTRTNENADFNYDTYWKNLQKKVTPFYKDDYFNNQPIKSIAKDRKDKGHSDYKESTIKIYPSTTNNASSDYIVDSVGGQKNRSKISGNYIENCIPYRYAQMALFGYNRIKIVIPGDPYISVGRIIFVYFPQSSRKPGEEGQKLDRFFTGYYLISALRHKLDQENNYETILELIKDSYLGRKSMFDEEKVGLDPYQDSSVEKEIKSDLFDW